MLEIEYPMDLNLIKSRLDNQFYRRTTAIQVVSFRLQRNLLHLSFRCNSFVLTTYTTDSEWCMFLFLYKPCYTRVSNNVFLFVRYFATNALCFNIFTISCSLHCHQCVLLLHDFVVLCALHCYTRGMLYVSCSLISETLPTTRSSSIYLL